MPIFDRSSKQPPVARNAPTVITTAVAKPKPAEPDPDPYLRRMQERGARLNLYFLNGEPL
jgi:hypothetical protein